MEKNKKDIYDRIYKFVLKVLQVINLISTTPKNLVLIKQVVRTAGSIGANASEADGAESKNVFLPVLKENNEIIAIISKIIINAKKMGNWSFIIYNLAL